MSLPSPFMYAAMDQIFSETMDEVADRGRIYSTAKAALNSGLFGRSNLTSDCESKYRKLFEDIRDNQDSYFEDMFSIPENHSIAENASAILGTLATIYRRRGDLKKAHEVIQIYTQVLDAYRNNVQEYHSNQHDIKRCMTILTYKHDLVVTNNYQELKKKDLCLPSFRRAVVYELVHLNEFERHNANIIPLFLGNKSQYYPLTAKKLSKISDDDLWHCLMTALSITK